MILLNPGPVTLSDRVRRALTAPDICHREPEFSTLQADIRTRLLNVYDLDPDAWAAVLLGGSGTAAVEAMIASLVPRDGHLMVIENGVYGERMSRIAKAHGVQCTPLGFEWGEPIDLDVVRRSLEISPGITHAAVVHHETTTGLLNPLEALETLCREHRVELLIDGVSSFGAESIRFEGRAACAGTANKCLHGAPGVSFVIVHRHALTSGCAPGRTLYLDLINQCREQDRHGTPFTPSIPAFYALREALEEHAGQGGWTARRERYTGLAESVRAGLAELDVEPYLPPASSSVVLRSYRIPEGISYETLHDHLKEHGFVIYAGQQRLSGSVFRISTMGEIETHDIERLLSAFRDIRGLSNRSTASS